MDWLVGRLVSPFEIICQYGGWCLECFFFICFWIVEWLFICFVWFFDYLIHHCNTRTASLAHKVNRCIVVVPGIKEVYQEVYQTPSLWRSWSVKGVSRHMNPDHLSHCHKVPWFGPTSKCEMFFHGKNMKKKYTFSRASVLSCTCARRASVQCCAVYSYG